MNPINRDDRKGSTVKLETEGLILRPWEDTDAEERHRIRQPADERGLA